MTPVKLNLTIDVRSAVGLTLDVDRYLYERDVRLSAVPAVGDDVELCEYGYQGTVTDRQFVAWGDEPAWIVWIAGADVHDDEWRCSPTGTIRDSIDAAGWELCPTRLAGRAHR